MHFICIFKFSNWPHTANNLLIVMATAALYFSLCIVLVVKQVMQAPQNLT